MERGRNRERDSLSSTTFISVWQLSVAWMSTECDFLSDTRTLSVSVSVSVSLSLCPSVSRCVCVFNEQTCVQIRLSPAEASQDRAESVCVLRCLLREWERGEGAVTLHSGAAERLISKLRM